MNGTLRIFLLTLSIGLGGCLSGIHAKDSRLSIVPESVERPPTVWLIGPELPAPYFNKTWCVPVSCSFNEPHANFTTLGSPSDLKTGGLKIAVRCGKQILAALYVPSDVSFWTADLTMQTGTVFDNRVEYAACFTGKVTLNRSLNFSRQP